MYVMLTRLTIKTRQTKQHDMSKRFPTVTYGFRLHSSVSTTGHGPGREFLGMVPVGRFFTWTQVWTHSPTPRGPGCYISPLALTLSSVNKYSTTHPSSQTSRYFFLLLSEQ